MHGKGDPAVRSEENRLHWYERFRNVKAYLNAKSGRPGPASALRAPGPWPRGRGGHRAREELQRRRALWHGLKSRIPVSYLRSIGADLEALQLAAARDYENFVVALSMPLYPRLALVEWQHMGEAPVELPPGIPEADAVSVLLDFAQNRGYRCSIHYPDLKTVLIEPVGRVERILYPPVLTFTESYVVPASSVRVQELFG